MRAKLVLQGANIPATLEAEEVLHRKGILSVPDFVANAGGVIMAAMEYAKKSGHDAFDAIETRIKANTSLILEKSINEKIPPRQAAVSICQRESFKGDEVQGILAAGFKQEGAAPIKCSQETARMIIFRILRNTNNKRYDYQNVHNLVRLHRPVICL
jgi:hypothetical protein